MQNKKNRTLVTLLIILVSLFVLQFTQYQFKWIKIKPLDGYYLDATKIKFSLKDWFSASYQKEQDKYLNDHFGFRSFFVRLNHQFRFSLFNKVKTAWVTVGKDNYLYEFNYISAIYGTDFIGYDSIATRMHKLKFVQDSFNNLGKELIVVLAVGKGSFYPEYIPDNFYDWSGTTNLEVYRQYMAEFGVKHIDFHQYFIDLKAHTPYPLYPQYGIHWSHYSMCLVIDSLVNYIEKARNIEMPHIYWDKVNMAKPRYPDNDISKAMNLLFPPRSFLMAYPDLKFESSAGKTKPAVLTIADSFYGGMFEIGLDSLFTNHQFWFYNTDIFPNCNYNWLTTREINYHEEILKNDVIILMGTDATLPNFGWGFIEEMYTFFNKQQDIKKSETN
ncbi:MAG: hypothetical protein FWC34_07745 [Bacteroidetes bacterium]|nr:hypothetical protein [Bacteroidota bacterium]MCL2302515.1 hypothetical protein [Lentimicrobiaceae bacterium]